MLYIVFRGDLKHIYGVRKKTRKKSKKTFKKVLTNGFLRGIIVKRSRETAKNERPEGLSEKAKKSA